MKQTQLVALVRAEGVDRVRFEIVARPDGYGMRYKAPGRCGRLLTTRGHERVFGHIETAIALLRRMGVTAATLDFTDWRPRKGLPGYLVDGQVD